MDPACDPSVLANLAINDPDAAVRQAAAMNPSTPAVALVECATREQDEGVRGVLCFHPCLPISTLIDLYFGDPDEQVRASADYQLWVRSDELDDETRTRHASTSSMRTAIPCGGEAAADGAHQ